MNISIEMINYDEKSQKIKNIIYNDEIKSVNIDHTDDLKYALLLLKYC